MGDQNCSLAILVRAWPDLAVDTSMRVLCVDYLLIKQTTSSISQSFQLRLSLGYQNLFVILSLSLSFESTLISLFSLVTSLIQTAP